MEHRQLAKGIFINTLGAFARISRGIFLIAFSRLLGSELFGLYVLAFAIEEIISKLALAGLDRGAMRVVGDLKSRGRTEDIRPTVMKIALLTFFISSAVAIALALSATWIAQVFGGKPELASPLRLFAMGMPPCCLTFVFLYSIRPTLDMRYEVYILSAIEPLVILALGMFGLHLGLGVRGTVFAHVFAYFIDFILALLCFRKLFPASNPTAKVNWRLLWNSAIPMGGVEFINMFKQRLDLFVIAKFLPLPDVGIYGAVVEIVNMLRKTRATFDPILMPILQKLHIHGEKKKLQENFVMAIRWVMTPSLAILGPMLLIPDAFLYFFGTDFKRGALSLAVLAFGQLFYTSFGLMESALAITGYAYTTLINSIVMILMNFVLLLVWVPMWGILGAAIATSVSVISVAMWRLFQGKQRLGIHPFHRSQLKPIGACLIGMGVGWSLRMILPWNRFLVSVMIGITFLIVYGTTLIQLKLESNDLDVLRRLRNRLPLLKPNGLAK